MSTLEANIRNTKTSGELKVIRNEGNVPGIIYGGSEKNKNVSTYRYNFSGEPIKGNHLTDAEAINDGYVSISILDYDLDNNELIESFKKFV